MSLSAPAAKIFETLAPSIVRLAISTLRAIARGDSAEAGRRAEEAGRRQAVRLAADARLRAKAKAKKL